MALSFVCYRKSVRDWARSVIPGLKFIYIDVDTDEAIVKNYRRLDKAMAQHGTTFLEYYQTSPDMEKFKDHYGATAEGLDKYIRDYFYNGQHMPTPEESDYIIIDNRGYAKQSISKLREFVGLSGDFEYNPDAIEAV